jgi:hypothetical protein
VIDDPKNRKIFLVQELMEGGALMPDSENCEPMGNEVRTLALCVLVLVRVRVYERLYVDVYLNVSDVWMWKNIERGLC